MCNDSAKPARLSIDDQSIDLRRLVQRAFDAALVRCVYDSWFRIVRRFVGARSRIDRSACDARPMRGALASSMLGRCSLDASSMHARWLCDVGLMSSRRSFGD